MSDDRFPKPRLDRAPVPQRPEPFPGLARAEAELAALLRWEVWFNRLGLLCTIPAGLVGAGIVVRSLWTRVAYFGKFHAERILRDEQPKYYWFAVCFTAAASACFLYLSFRLFRSAKFGRKNAT